ncbi:RNA polymerase sigma factor SigZ [Agarivorans sp. Toyoura001]|uniref:RNA polymerase sigma factor SigZ n=1 Tax=Agarivorans sp. Toyoura001 TaxID=2283141 RepID=UPI0010E48381|nr:RNA polymerase sigma factor SigZ [Agarivorans sp. Toyoura001]GDY27579.1 RNA polymerase sigma factor SigZ [Agarivorans sp. Toyoura001]
MKIEQVWQQYRQSLKAFLHANVSNPADVDDLLQEILIKTYQNFSQLQDHSKVKSWLFQIANRSIIDFYRQRGQADKLENNELWYTEADESVHQQLASCISPFIHALPSDEADMLVSIELEGMGQRDYAAQHQIKYSTLKSRVQKSREKVLQLFQSCCQFSIDAEGRLVEFAPKKPGCKSC